MDPERPLYRLLLGLAQGSVIVSIIVGLLKAPNEGGLFSLTGLIVLDVATAAGLGLFLSSFAKTELQVVQFIPLALLPQIFLCGLIWPIEDLPYFLRPISRCLPLSYAVDASREFMIRGDIAMGMNSVYILGLSCLGSVILAAVTLRRRIL